MAKVIAPLFSMGASGKLGNSLVYMTWKGIDDVRIYVIPANPNTAAQQTQRGYFTSAVGYWHTIAFNALDKTAFNLWAAQAASARSGFNRFVQEVVNVLKAGDAWGNLYGMAVSAVLDTSFDIACTGVTAKTYSCKYGTTPSTMNTIVSMTNTAGALTKSITGLSASTTYYFQVYNTTANEGDTTGIYKQKTAAA